MLTRIPEQRRSVADPMLSPRRTVIAVLCGIFVLGFLGLSGKLYEYIEADSIVVIQSPISGELKWYTNPGLVWQGFGDVTVYKKRATYSFEDTGYEARFADGGHGTIFGSIQYELPLTTEQLTAMHVKYRNMGTLQSDLIVKATNSALYLVGTLMTSKESYAEKKNDLIHYVTDQTQHGIYRTRQKSEWITDPVTKETKQIITADIIKDVDGNPERQEKSAVDIYGLKVSLFTINKLPYDPVVEAQIKQQQQISMNVQTSVAEALMAEQRARTVEQQGKANAAEARWKQETIKAQAVTEAEQQATVAKTNADRDAAVAKVAADRDKVVAETQGNQRLTVADLDRRSAEQKKLEQIALGEGEAQRKKLVLDADGALTQKLDAYIKVNQMYAQAMQGSHWVPTVVMGGGANGLASNSGAQDLIALLSTKAAKDLALDLTVPTKPNIRLSESTQEKTQDRLPVAAQVNPPKVPTGYVSTGGVYYRQQ